MGKLFSCWKTAAFAAEKEVEDVKKKEKCGDRFNRALKGRNS